MPAVTLYEVSIVSFAKGLKTLKLVLEKAAESAKDKGTDPDAFVNATLAEDMRGLAFQVQVASNTVKKSIWRLTGTEVESWPDNETTLAQLIARTQRTVDLLDTVTAESIEGIDDTIVELQMGKNGTFNLPAKSYVLNYALPNFFFHLQTAYAILRAKGVPLGKTDYLSNFMK
ncbi:helix-turn-helix- domain containing protein type [Ophiostoma piceae UAMH 11346]|uniref:Helix-turn-helix-domain containing protein type n=1 Tax=Ophiostoma piceae (strain UAMH 11346) TaxID=1262450 RepID=S3CPS9_OPHP1|nr:helix-turn-helix- domain containing protein type [Ophiostoma piceae UAMH 11346]